MNGIIVVNKEKGMTSHDVVNKIRKIFNTKKVGHLGTLDPDAEGVLAVCINDATKLVQFLENETKEYIAGIRLGIGTDTYDLSGKIINDMYVNDINANTIDECLNSFLGKSMQMPPIYSAIKINGRKLYEYARNNIDVEIKPRSINISYIERTSAIHRNEKYLEFNFKVIVSKGTYIRSLCKDIGEKLNYPAVMSSLLRTRSGVFKINEASTIDEISSGKYKLYSMEEAVINIALLTDSDSVKKAYHGMKISKNVVFEKYNDYPNLVRIMDNDKLIAIYEYDDVINCYRAARVWN